MQYLLTIALIVFGANKHYPFIPGLVLTIFLGILIYEQREAYKLLFN